MKRLLVVLVYSFVVAAFITVIAQPTPKSFNQQVRATDAEDIALSIGDNTLVGFCSTTSTTACSVDGDCPGGETCLNNKCIEFLRGGSDNALICYDDTQDAFTLEDSVGRRYLTVAMDATDTVNGSGIVEWTQYTGGTGNGYVVHLFSIHDGTSPSEVARLRIDEATNDIIFQGAGGSPNLLSIDATSGVATFLDQIWSGDYIVATDPTTPTLYFQETTDPDTYPNVGMIEVDSTTFEIKSWGNPAPITRITIDQTTGDVTVAQDLDVDGATLTIGDNTDQDLTIAFDTLSADETIVYETADEEFWFSDPITTNDHIESGNYYALGAVGFSHNDSMGGPTRARLYGTAVPYEMHLANQDGDQLIIDGTADSMMLAVTSVETEADDLILNSGQADRDVTVTVDLTADEYWMWDEAPGEWRISDKLHVEGNLDVDGNTVEFGGNNVSLTWRSDWAAIHASKGFAWSKDADREMLQVIGEDFDTVRFLFQYLTDPEGLVTYITGTRLDETKRDHTIITSPLAGTNGKIILDPGSYQPGTLELGGGLTDTVLIASPGGFFSDATEAYDCVADHNTKLSHDTKPLGNCSVTTATQCDDDADCPGGEYCDNGSALCECTNRIANAYEWIEVGGTLQCFTTP